MSNEIPQNEIDKSDKPLPLWTIALIPVYISILFIIIFFPLTQDWSWIEAWLFIISFVSSHAAIHTWPEHGYISIDIFICDEFSKGLKVIQFLKDQFNPQKFEFFYSERGKDFNMQYEPIVLGAQYLKNIKKNEKLLFHKKSKSFSPNKCNSNHS